jgi:hypothetical protein
MSDEQNCDFCCKNTGPEFIAGKMRPSGHTAWICSACVKGTRFYKELLASYGLKCRELEDQKKFLGRLIVGIKYPDKGGRIEMADHGKWVEEIRYKIDAGCPITEEDAEVLLDAYDALKARIRELEREAAEARLTGMREALNILCHVGLTDGMAVYASEEIMRGRAEGVRRCTVALTLAIKEAEAEDGDE